MLPWLARMRAAAPVHYEERTGQWHVFTHAESLRVLADVNTFSSDFSEMVPPKAELVPFAKSNFVGMDPPRHHELRRLVMQAFTRRAVDRLEPRVTAITTELLDRAAGSARLDLVADLAYPLPVIVIAELIGIPTSDLPTFRQWAEVLLSTASGGAGYASDAKVVDNAGPALAEMAAYLREHVRYRQSHPGEDLTSNLIAAEVDGERLDSDEIVGVAALLLIAGHITTTAALSTAVVILDGHRDTMAELRSAPQLLPPAVEEVLRYGSPFTQTYRRARHEAEVGGRSIGAGQVITVWLASANRDESVFTNPDEVDIRRAPNPHLSFGHGVHFCLGAPLARMELRVALRILLDRYPAMAVVHDEAEGAYPIVGAVTPRRLMVDVAGG